jgi:hypothetical protein
MYQTRERKRMKFEEMFAKDEKREKMKQEGSWEKNF